MMYNHGRKYKYEKVMGVDKNKISFWLCLSGGWLGLHKFYNKEYGKGILYLFTVGLFLFGWIIDSIILYRVAFVMAPEEIEEWEKRLAEQSQARAEKRAEWKEKQRQAFAEYQAKQQAEKSRLEQLKQEHVPYCSKCHSTNLVYLEHGKKLSLSRAVAGGVIAGAPGAVLGGLTSNKTKGHMKCLNCGHTWKI